MRRRTLPLSEAQRAELEHARDRDHRPYLRERAAALLKIAQGQSPHAVARHGLHKRRKAATVYDWLNRYRERGLAGLVQRPRGHRGLSPRQGEQVAETVCQPPELHGIGRARWRLRDLREALACLSGYSLPGISKVLKRRRVSRQRGRLHLHSPDPAYRDKLAWVDRVRALALLPPRPRERQLTVLYGDEFTLYRQPTLAPTYAPRGRPPTARLSQRANTKCRFSGALDLRTGRLTWLARSLMGVTNLKRFLTKLRLGYPADRLVLIWDNWPVHQHPEVLARAAELEVELLWLPTYAPWTNPIEKLWRWLKQDLLHHHGLADHWEELKRRVKAWLDRFAQPAPDLLRYVGEAH